MYVYVATIFQYQKSMLHFSVKRGQYYINEYVATNIDNIHEQIKLTCLVGFKVSRELNCYHLNTLSINNIGHDSWERRNCL